MRSIVNFLLVIVAIVLFILVTPCAFIWKVWASFKDKSRKAKDITKGIAFYFLETATSFDQTGNTVFGGFFNWLFLNEVPVKYPFGDKDETISEVFGWNNKLNSLNKYGLRMVKVLDKLDANHCEKSRLIGIKKAKEKTEAHNIFLKAVM
ncbi:hypothetical protein PL373_09645 [Tenacibaculum maritimum]|nr:hypothetical protein [Tenacibaculum maritimum]MDB0600058.1 hypothetical protein [Tenacibaculum maritimum]MDB0601061.1 hypothetical protein [Tenacibaculum maritimum]MDB0601409.1 hypothetical protein [Tenacibaculum maritimum]MDB0611827.1 hypothetical protein [Tenacibaculum maritimum]MDB0612142.1 hypothetical protein [Tenacibaculum maritimum]